MKYENKPKWKEIFYRKMNLDKIDLKYYHFDKEKMRSNK